MSVLTLTSRPSLEHLRKQAKQRAKERALSLSDAQLELARDYGFASWPKLKHHVEDEVPAARWREALAALRAGKTIVLYDDIGGEDEADLVLAAEKATAPAINFITRYARGTLCLAMAPERIDRLALRLIAPEREHKGQPAFTVSIDARHGVTTGVSAADRAHTILAAVSDDAQPHDFRSPGHVFPLRAEKDGVLARAGHTEGSVDLMLLAGLAPAAVICEVLNDDGTMARWRDLDALVKEHALPVLKLSEVLERRKLAERRSGS